MEKVSLPINIFIIITFMPKAGALLILEGWYKLIDLCQFFFFQKR